MPNHLPKRRACLTLLALAMSLAGWSERAAKAQDSGFALPTERANWLNSPPLSREALAGKAALLWFFEESCPRCRERWPALLATAKKYEGKPIVFIAVNSGNSAATVASYARQNRIDWPIVVDSSRELEQAAGVGEISLQNIYQARLLLPDGRLGRADSSDIAGAADRALGDAKWSVEPEGIPASLRSAWYGVEFKEYAAVAAQIRRATGSRKPDEKAAADRLMACVVEQLEKDAAAAAQLRASGQAWPAYKAYAELAERFKGYDLPPDAVAAMRELGTDAGVKQELIAQKIFEAAEKLYANPRTRGSAVSRLKTLVQQHPDTEAGREAQRVLLQLGV